MKKGKTSRDERREGGREGRVERERKVIKKDFRLVWGTNENGNELRVNVDGAAHSTLHLIISVDILFTSLANPRHTLPPLRSCNTHSFHSFPLHIINLQGSLSSSLTTSPRNPLSTDFPSTHFMQHPLHLSLPHNTPRLLPPPLPLSAHSIRIPSRIFSTP